MSTRSRDRNESRSMKKIREREILFPPASGSPQAMLSISTLISFGLLNFTSVMAFSCSLRSMIWSTADWISSQTETPPARRGEAKKQLRCCLNWFNHRQDFRMAESSKRRIRQCYGSTLAFNTHALDAPESIRKTSNHKTVYFVLILKDC